MSDTEPTYGRLPGRLESPAVRRMAQVAELLGDTLRKRVVFIGASLLPLVETEENVLSASRATDDVDAVTATTSYSQKFALEEALRARGFRNDVRRPTHVDRWIAPDGVIFDCVACGRHTGGTGNDNDLWVIDHAVETDLPPRARHASAVGLLRLKLALDSWYEAVAGPPRYHGDIHRPTSITRAPSGGRGAHRAASHLESLDHKVIVADPNYAPMYANRSRRPTTDQRDCEGADTNCRVGSLPHVDDGTGAALRGVRAAHCTDRGPRRAHRRLRERGADRGVAHHGAGRGPGDRGRVRGHDR